MSEAMKAVRVQGYKIDATILCCIAGAAILWWLSGYFVSQKQYDRDQGEVKSTLQEMKGDIKELLKRR